MDVLVNRENVDLVLTLLGAQPDGRTELVAAIVRAFPGQLIQDSEQLTARELEEALIAAVYRRFGPEVESGAGSLLRTLLWRVYTEGLARYSTLPRRFREDREVCFDALQKAIDGVGAGGTWNLHGELFTGSGGRGHLGSTAGVFMFEALEAHLSPDRLVEVTGAGVDGVIEEYQRVAAREGLPILRLPA
jgi:hypothetical protein